jgi:hypothetical protein
VVTAREGAATLCDQPLEAVGIELVGLDLEPVTASVGDEDTADARRRVLEELPQMRNVDLERIQRSLRLAVAPELIDQALRAHSLVRVEEKNGEQRALARALERNWVAPPIPDLDRPKNPELHPALPGWRAQS